MFSLAVEGRLVPQIPSDEPAEVLLRRLNPGGVIEKIEDPPYLLPRGWSWARFDRVADIESNLVNPADFPNATHVAPDNIEKGTGRLLSCRTISEDKVTSPKHQFRSGHLLYSKIRPNLSKVVIAPFSGLCSADMYPVAAKINAEYLKLYMLSDAFLRQVVRDDNRVAMPKVNQRQLTSTLVAVPPLPEQERIVRRVRELLRLNEELESAQEVERGARHSFRTVVLGELARAQPGADVLRAWGSLATSFDALIDEAACVDQLRNTVVWLSVHGRLRTNEGTDESGAFLLERIRAERKAAWEAQRSKSAAGTGARSRDARVKYAAPQPITCSDLLAEAVPPNWAAASLEELADVIDPNPSHRYPTYVDGTVPLLSTREFYGRGDWQLDDPELPRVPPAVHDEQLQRCGFAPTDIILARKGRLGLARHPPAIKRFAFSHTLFVVKPTKLISSEFLLWYLRLDEVVAWLRREMNDNVGVPTLGKATTERLPVPIPPRAEQDRIVRSIENLLRLCDSLEGGLVERDAACSQLAAAVAADV